MKSKHEDAIKNLLLEIGEDPEREGLVKTPHRFMNSLAELTSGYKENVSDILKDAFFDEFYTEMVVVRDIEFYSLCEHHMLPFYGRCHVGYIPNKRIIGLSKIPRVVDVFARRLQVQERLTNQIGETLESSLEALGVGVIMEATHLCMTMRGVQKQNSFAVTSCMRGLFLNAETRNEFLNIVHSRSHKG